MRVVIVEDSGLFLEALADALSGRGVQVVGRARDIDGALRVIDETAPDVALIDIRLPPDLSDEGIQLAELVCDRYPGVGLLVLSGYAEVAYAERLLRMRHENSPGVGYLLKDRVSDLNGLVDAIRSVAAGDVEIDETIVTRLFTRPRTVDPLAGLTPHERRILKLVAQGRSNLGIAQHLDCKISTVEKHISAITTKLGMAAMSQADRRRVNVRVLATLAFLRSN